MGNSSMAKSAEHAFQLLNTNLNAETHNQVGTGGICVKGCFLKKQTAFGDVRRLRLQALTVNESHPSIKNNPYI